MESRSFAERLKIEKSINKKLMQVGDSEQVDWNELVRRQLMPSGRLGETVDDSICMTVQNKSFKPRSTLGDRLRLSLRSRAAKEQLTNQQLSTELLTLKSRLNVLDQIIDLRKQELADDNFRFFEENSEQQLEEIKREVGGRSDWTLEDIAHQIEIAEQTAERCRSNPGLTS
jgi:hypothetical protein